MSYSIVRTIFISVISGTIFLSAFLPNSVSLADERENKQYQLQVAPATVNEYSRGGSVAKFQNKNIDITTIAACTASGATCTVDNSSAAIIKTECTPGQIQDGGWTADLIAGHCPKLTLCYGSGTSSEVCYDFGGTFVAADDVLITPFSGCDTNDSSIGHSEKLSCIFNYAGASGITHNTGDDMFRIDDGGGAFFEYTPLGGPGNPYSLKWIERNGGDPTRGVMMPSGPPGTYTDYMNFIDNAPSFITVEDACYPVTVEVCSALTIVPPAVQGVCGPANSQPLGTYNTISDIASSDFCDIGSPTSQSEDAIEIAWVCTGVNGGANSPQCNAEKFVPLPVCGSSTDGQTFADATALLAAGPLCDAGTEDATPSGIGPWSWNCENALGDTVACSATPPALAACGPADGGSYTTASNLLSAGPLCTVGTSSSTPSGSGPWSWTCTDSSSNTASCSASVAVVATCGPADGRTFSSVSNLLSAGPLCDVGTANSTPSGSGPWSWICTDASSNTDSCSASVGATATCGPADGKSYATASDLLAAGALCDVGTANSTPSGSGPWGWSCTSGASTTGCSASVSSPPAVCGSAHGGSYATASDLLAAGSLCSVGSASSTPSGSGPWSWTCLSSGGNDSCSASVSSGPVGSCGAADGQDFFGPVHLLNEGPLCDVGSASSTPSGSGPWSWTCAASGGNDSCSAGVDTSSACAGGDVVRLGGTKFIGNLAINSTSITYNAASVALDPQGDSLQFASMSCTADGDAGPYMSVTTSAGSLSFTLSFDYAQYEIDKGGRTTQNITCTSTIDDVGYASANDNSCSVGQTFTAKIIPNAL